MEATRWDLILSQVLLYTRLGWPTEIPQTLQPYHRRMTELTIEQDCLLWSICVVVPSELKQAVLEELHQSHSSNARMKAVARSYLWWRRIDQEIEQQVRSCSKCQSIQSTPPVAHLHPWLWPSQPWQSVHVDFAAPVQGKMLLDVIDAHFKWPEIFELTTTTATATIKIMRNLNAAYGLPKQLVSDNGPQFISTKFATFLRNNDVKHIRSSIPSPISLTLLQTLTVSIHYNYY